MRASEIAFVSMDSHMLVKIALLSEGLIASENWTNEWLLLCVRTQMVEEVVPFFKDTSAVLVLAKENLSPPFAFRFKVFNIFKCAHIRHVQTFL